MLTRKPFKFGLRVRNHNLSQYSYQNIPHAQPLRQFSLLCTLFVAESCSKIKNGSFSSLYNNKRTRAMQTIVISPVDGPWKEQLLLLVKSAPIKALRIEMRAD